MPDTDALAAGTPVDAADRPPSTAHLDATREDAASSRTRRSCGSRASRRIPAHAADCRRAADWLAAALTAAGAGARRGRRDRRPPGRLRGLAPRAGRPDGPRLRPLRRPAGRPARAVDVAAVRAGRRRRPDPRPRRGRRQGPGPRSRHGGRRPSWRPRGALPGQRQVRLRGRGGIELGPPRRVARRRTASGSRPTSRSSATRASSRATCPAITLSLRGIMYAQIDVVGTRGRPPFGRLRRGRPEPGQRPRPDHRRRSRARTAGSAIPGFYDDVVPLVRGGSGGARRAAVRRGRVPARARPAGARRRGRLHHPRAPRRPGRRSTSTACGAGSRARAARRSSRPTPTPRSAAGSSPTRIPTGSSRRSATTSRRSPRPASTTTVQLPRRRPTRA